MNTHDNRTEAISTIPLRVSDLRRSERFYGEVFGLVRTGEMLPDHPTWLCLRPPEAESAIFAIALRRQRPAGGARHITRMTLEVSTLDELIECYVLAKVVGGRAARPRVYEGRWQCLILDPDGHEIVLTTEDTRAIVASDDPEIEESAPGDPMSAAMLGACILMRCGDASQRG